jgi:hypothetical protein
MNCTLWLPVSAVAKPGLLVHTRVGAQAKTHPISTANSASNNDEFRISPPGKLWQCRRNPAVDGYDGSIRDLLYESSP